MRGDKVCCSRVVLRGMYLWTYISAKLIRIRISTTSTAKMMLRGREIENDEEMREISNRKELSAPRVNRSASSFVVKEKFIPKVNT